MGFCWIPFKLVFCITCRFLTGISENPPGCGDPPGVPIVNLPKVSFGFPSGEDPPGCPSKNPPKIS